jgi:hypothetical protein
MILFSIPLKKLLWDRRVTMTGICKMGTVSSKLYDLLVFSAVFEAKLNLLNSYLSNVFVVNTP